MVYNLDCFLFIECSESLIILKLDRFKVSHTITFEKYDYILN